MTESSLLCNSRTLCGFLAVVAITQSPFRCQCRPPRARSRSPPGFLASWKTPTWWRCMCLYRGCITGVQGCTLYTPVISGVYNRGVYQGSISWVYLVTCQWKGCSLCWRGWWWRRRTTFGTRWSTRRGCSPSSRKAPSPAPPLLLHLLLLQADCHLQVDCYLQTWLQQLPAAPPTWLPPPCLLGWNLDCILLSGSAPAEDFIQIAWKSYF